MTTRPAILYSLPDGAQSSVLLRTALFEELTRGQQFDWTFVSPLAGDADFARNFARPHVKLVLPPRDGPSLLDRNVQFLREELFRRKQNGATAQILSRRMRWLSRKRAWFHHPVAYVLSRLPAAAQMLDKLEMLAIGDGGWQHHLDELRPAAVVLGSAGIKLAELPLARAAQRRSIPSFGIVPSWDNLTTKGPLIVGCKRLAVWCEALRREAVELHGYRAEDVTITGPPSFDAHAQRPTREEVALFLRALGFDPSRRLIVYTSVPRDVCPHSHRYAELIADWIAADCFGHRAQLLIRLHPRDNPAAFRPLASRPHVRIDRPGRYRGPDVGVRAIQSFDPSAADVRRLTETLVSSDVVVNMGSTITLEACGLDRPVVNIAFNPPRTALNFDFGEYYRMEHYRPVMDSHAVPVARSANELLEEIRTALARPDERSAARRALYRAYDPFGDGRAAVRLAQEILAFADLAVGKAPHWRRVA